MKFKTPWEWTVSALRGLGARDVEKPPAAQMLNQLGQPIWQPKSPEGYDDIAASWAAPEALALRVDLAQRLVATVDDQLDPRTLGPRLLPETLSPMTETEVERAESRKTGLALLLVSPDFLRR